MVDRLHLDMTVRHAKARNHGQFASGRQRRRISNCIRRGGALSDADHAHWAGKPAESPGNSAKKRLAGHPARRINNEENNDKERMLRPS